MDLSARESQWDHIHGFSSIDPGRNDFVGNTDHYWFDPSSISKFQESKITHPYFIVIYIHDHTTYVCTYVYAYIKVTDLGEHWYPLVVLNSQALQGSALLGAGSLWLQTCEVLGVWLSAGSGFRLRCCFPLITDWVGWISLGFGCVCFYDKMHATDLCGRFFCLFQGLILSMGAFLCTSNLCRWITASLGMCPSANSHLQSDVVEKHGTNTVGQS